MFGSGHVVARLQLLSISLGAISRQARIKKEFYSFREEILSRDLQLTLFRIIQEQLNNIIKHGDAKSIAIVLERSADPHYAELLIHDYGKGFDSNRKRDGVGLRNIKSRAELFAGKVTLVSQANAG